MKRHPDLQRFVDDLSKKMWGKSLAKCLKEEICVCCHKPVKDEDFKDELEKKEYKISALCPKCQL